jgi:AcrR family transcriptional regulator
MPGREQRRPAAPARRRTRYHHGALRQALLEAAESVLADAGVEGFTLRECARRAGVSHGAPAHHFGDVQGLLSELTADSFEALATLMGICRGAAASDGFSQLEASGLAYLEYALAHPARFQLMFRSKLLDASHPRLVAAGGQAYAQLEETMAATSRDAGAPASLLGEKTALAWSIVHGVASLVLDNRGFAERAAGSPGGARDLLRTLIRLSRPAFESMQLAD